MSKDSKTAVCMINNVKGYKRSDTFPNLPEVFTFRLCFSHTDSVPEDCDQDMFQSLALTLLACFSTDPVLAQHPDMLQKVPFLADVILLQR